MAISIFPFRRLTTTKVGGPGYDYMTERDFRQDTPPDGADREVYKYFSGRRKYRLLESRTTESGSTSSGITVSTITATLTAGGNLPTADTWSIVLACSGDCSGISFSNQNLSSVLSGCCANRVFDFTAVNGTGSGSNITLTPAGDGFTGTIEGGDTTPGTPYVYIPAATDLMTYTGTDSTNLPGVAAFTDTAVAVDGDAVPVRAIYNYVTGSYVTVQFSRQLTTLVGDDGSEMSGTFERVFFHGTSMGASSDTAVVDIEFGAASGATDKVIYAGGTSGFIDDDTNAVEAFQFPMLAGPDTLRDPLIFSPMLLRLA